MTLDGSKRVEFIECALCSIWELGETPSLHHVGLWFDDIAAGAERLVRSSPLAVAGDVSVDGALPGYFSAAANPLGATVELVDITMQAGMATGSVRE